MNYSKKESYKKYISINGYKTPKSVLKRINTETIIGNPPYKTE